MLSISTMNVSPFRLNLLLAWGGILAGFISGCGLGMFFHREDWLGGYGSLPRRMYRLAHISLFGLGAANLLFYLTVANLAPTRYLEWASSAFIVGACTMPICCVIMAHAPRLRLLFAVPVISLLAAGTLTVIALARGS
jgi:hypothetical protein